MHFESETSESRRGMELELLSFKLCIGLHVKIIMQFYDRESLFANGVIRDQDIDVHEAFGICVGENSMAKKVYNVLFCLLYNILFLGLLKAVEKSGENNFEKVQAVISHPCCRLRCTELLSN